MDIDIDYIYIYIYNNPKTQNINLTQKPKSKPTQPKYPKLTHKFITKSKGGKKSMADFKKQKQYLKRCIYSLLTMNQSHRWGCDWMEPEMGGAGPNT